MSSKKFFGKYRGTVLNNVDPMKIGRILATVPDVHNLLPSTWAMPCVPIANKASGTFFVPQVGAGVWIEFEHGDSDYPIWVGGYWGIAAETPPFSLVPPPGDPPIVLSTTGQHTVLISDLPVPPMVAGGIMLMSGASTIVIGPASVQITSPLITLDGVVNINKGALTVTI